MTPYDMTDEQLRRLALLGTIPYAQATGRDPMTALPASTDNPPHLVSQGAEILPAPTDNRPSDMSFTLEQAYPDTTQPGVERATTTAQGPDGTKVAQQNTSALPPATPERPMSDLTDYYYKKLSGQPTAGTIQQEPAWAAALQQSRHQSGAGGAPTGDVHSMPGTSSGGGPGGGGGLSGNDALGLLAIGMDLLANRGRGIGPIVAMMAEAPGAQHKKQLDLEKEQAEIDHLRRSGTDPQMVALRQAELDARMQQLDIERQSLGIRNRSQNTREQALGRQINADDPRTVASRQWLYAHGAEPGSLEGLDYKALQQLMATERQNMTTREGSPLATQDVEHAGQRAEAIAREQQPYMIARAEAGAQAHENVKQEPVDQYIQGLASNPDIRGHFTDGGQTLRARLMLNPRGANQSVDYISANNRAIDAMDEMSRIEKAWKDLGVVRYVPKTGLFSVIQQLPLDEKTKAEYEKASELEQEYTTLATEVQGVMARIAQTAGSAAEREEAKQGLPGIGNFVANPRLQGVRQMLTTNTAANMAVIGMAPDSAEESQKKRSRHVRKRTAPSPSPMPMLPPQNGMSPQALPVTSGATPKVSQVVNASPLSPLIRSDGSQVTRNGKPVSSIDKQRINGQLVVTIHYTDGSTERVQRSE